MKELERITIKNGVEFLNVPADRFKTNEMMISFVLPLSADTASRNALLLQLLSRCSKAYPNIQALNRKLAMLYGASLNTNVTKQGKYQILTLFLSALDDRFSIDNEAISEESAKLLLSLLFSPKLDNDGCFFSEDIEREKSVLAEKLESEANEKRLYSLRRLEEEMFRDEAFGVNPLGTLDAIKKVTKEDLKAALNDFTCKAKTMILSVGNASKDNIKALIEASFSSIERDYTELEKAELVPFAKEVKTVEERQAVKQGKLVLGFRVNLDSADDRTTAMRIFTDVFGGGPYSKLFMNVREKLSLCYYCSARYLRRNNCIIIQCGCEEENMDKAVNEILNQIEDIKNGNFETEFDSSKKGLTDSVRSVIDDSTVLLGWYLSQVTDGEALTPEEVIAQYEEVSFDDIRYSASLLSLDTVYKLMSVKEAE